MPSSPHHDFDFLFGRWQVRHQRLKERLVGCTQWETFEGRSSARPLLDGFGNVDDNWIDLPGGAYRAATLRAFDPASATWSIWWLDGRYPDRIDVPMRGSFSDGVGRFFADETIGGRPVRVRFLWSDITATTCRWQQAFSVDRGDSWETNWRMEFTRAD